MQILIQEVTIGKTRTEKFQILLNCNFLVGASSAQRARCGLADRTAVATQAAVHPAADETTPVGHLAWPMELYPRGYLNDFVTESLQVLRRGDRS